MKPFEIVVLWKKVDSVLFEQVEQFESLEFNPHEGLQFREVNVLNPNGLPDLELDLAEAGFEAELISFVLVLFQPPKDIGEHDLA